jgi:hypothetical protein
VRRILPVLFALTLLSGCGGADSSLFATAVRNTENAGGAELAFQVTVPSPAGGQPVVMTGTGVEDLAEQQARIDMQIPGAGDMQLVADELVMYIHFPVLAQGLGGKEWMKLDLEHAYGITEEGREQVRGVQTTHYSATVDLRKYPDDDVERSSN